MHGRVKVRTSEEEKAKKERERQEKLKAFKYAMNMIRNKRKEGELNKELLDLTGKVLSSNPDIYTLWNIRREILVVLSKYNDDVINEELQADMSNLYDAELQLTEYCLKINPKSYSAWHQREWILTTRPDPDWQQELVVCNKYLKLDERNFLTWDYRRFVVSQSKPSLKDEFDFTTEKLHDNFSNYSAWHYRSKILIGMYPDLKGGRLITDSPMEEIRHKQELKMVQSAAFTDPDDTSAWFYQRWLLGAVKRTCKLVTCVVTPSKTTFAFSDPVLQSYVTQLTRLSVNNVIIKGNWVPCTGSYSDVLWIYEHDQEITSGMQIEAHFESITGNDTIKCVEEKPLIYVGKLNVDFSLKYSGPVIEELNNQLDSCRQLLALEPDNKWTLLTTTVFLYCIDGKKYHKEILENLQTLKTIDKLRAGYYDYLTAKWSVEQQLYEDCLRIGLEFNINFEEKIMSLPHLQYYSYCEIVDLSNQNLISCALPSLVLLPHCKKLNLQNNKLTTLKGFPKLQLEELNLKGNEDLSTKEVEEFKEKCKFSVIF